MGQRNRSEFFQLVIVGMLVVGLFFSFALLPSSGHATEVTFENCEPGTWVGGVRWLWGAAGEGVYVGADYEDVPELELKGAGSLVVDLAPGDYAITHYQPRQRFRTEDGGVFTSPAKVVGFIEIEVADEPVTFSFGCVD